MLKKTTRGMTAGMTRRGVGFAVAGGGAGYDTDAQAYITLVEAADGQSLETGVKDAINAFVVGCKADGIWTAIKASCILAGARTLTGALVPLVGTAPTNNNFVSGDYSRTAGLTGDGSTKYLNSNRANNADPQDSNHNAVYVSAFNNDSIRLIGGNSNPYATGDNVILTSSGLFVCRNRNSTGDSTGIARSSGFAGVSRAASTAYSFRGSSSTATFTRTSQTPSATSVTVFNGGSTAYADCTIAFYSIGESLDLALLDSRVSTLITDIGTALA